jgi:uncharacterized protein DUF3291
MTLHLAQMNIGRMRAPIESDVMAGFVARLAEINALAEASDGFVWRFQGEGGNATYLRPYDDPLIIFNMSVWTSVEALQRYAYTSAHRELLRARSNWFEKFDGPYQAMWWISAGHEPTVEEAKGRLAYLREHGDTRHAFSFAKLYPPATDT